MPLSEDLTLRALERAAPAATPRELSLVVPIHDEVDNLLPLYERVVEALGPTRQTWELVLVDDGSRDGSDASIRRLARHDERVRGVFFARNRGQSTAMCAGIHVAVGELVATMDGDLQNDPVDLPGMIAALGEHDAVVGYRMDRKDDFVRRVSSKIANAVRNRITRDSVRDTGCSLKVFRREAIRSIPFFEGSHRFLPTLLRYQGFSVVEHGVRHRPRVAGRSKYGIGNRLIPSLLDLFAVRWMRSRLIRVPLKHVDGADRTESPHASQAAPARELEHH